MRLKFNIKLFSKNTNDSNSFTDDDYFLDNSSYKKYHANDNSTIDEHKKNKNKKYKFELKVINTNKLFQIDLF